MNNWIEIKSDIQNSLMKRNLKNPKIRLNALDKIEAILKEKSLKYIDDINEFKEIDKDTFKNDIAKFKDNKKLNGAEKSIVNEIFYRIKE